MDTFFTAVKRVIPRSLFTLLQPSYHFALAWYGAQKYGHPSRKITVIGVTGTKGKSSTTELIAHILRGSGKRVASLSTIQFAIDNTSERNLFKMTMPGRFFVQQFLRKAVDASCEIAVIEMTSEGAKQFRHRFIEIDTLVFTNLSPEHIESHGSFEKYKEAKLSIAEAVVASKKRPRTIIANADDIHGADFLAFPIEHPLPYSLSDLTLYTLHKDSISVVFDDVTIRVPLVGLFNVYNVLAAITTARHHGVGLGLAAKSLRELTHIAGRVEHFYSPKDAWKPIIAVVDYAHTPDSLQKLYEAFKDKPKVCVLGNTGGGRDTWKRPEMGTIAEQYCDHIILTNEDPYDEDPQKIVDEMARGISKKETLSIIMDRRTAIKTAMEMATEGGYVLISGKGTDPYIMGPNGTREVWSDAAVVKELLEELA